MVIPDADGDADNDGGDTSGGHELDVFSGAAAFFLFFDRAMADLAVFLRGSLKSSEYVRYAVFWNVADSSRAGS